MNIYRLYMQNGNAAGFWIQHRTWQNMCAQVQSIAGQRTGGLPTGIAPSPADVCVQCFDVRSGRPVPPLPAIGQPEDRGFVLIAEPSWYKRPPVAEAKTVA